MLKKIIHDTIFKIPDIDISLEGDVLLIDKPYRCTSFDVVGKIKNYIKHKYKTKVKVGHAGTLDPLATGLLIICIGKYTKQIENYQAQEKEYTGTFRLGETTPSFDKEKPVDATFPVHHINNEMILHTAQSFVGDSEQVPPQFSAVWIDGKRAFEYAREGEAILLKSKKITISTFEITRISLPDVDFRIVCSKGTYIRSIARDFGFALDTGAHLTALRRTRIGEYDVKDAITIADSSTDTAPQGD